MSLLHWRAYYASILELTRIVKTHSRLIWEFSKRDISDRYAGQLLGSAWALCHPLILMGLYIFVFGFILKLRPAATEEMGHSRQLADYTTYLLSGLIPWMSLQESMARATTAILNQANLVKQVIFPVEALAIKSCMGALFTLLVALFFFACYLLISFQSLPWTTIFVPFLVILQLVLMVGLALGLSAISVFFRDIKDIIQVLLTALFFSTPIFFFLKDVPGPARLIMWFNPVTHMVMCFQDAIYYGAILHPWSWVINFVLSLAALAIGSRIFLKLKHLFGNII